MKLNFTILIETAYIMKLQAFEKLEYILEIERMDIVAITVVFHNKLQPQFT